MMLTDSLQLDLFYVPKNCPEQVEQFAKHVWETGWRALPKHCLPHWLKDNDYIIKGYRPPLPSIRACFASIFRWHNETVNIWTHGLGKFLFMLKGTCAVYFMFLFILILFRFIILIRCPIFCFYLHYIFVQTAHKHQLRGEVCVWRVFRRCHSLSPILRPISHVPLSLARSLETLQQVSLIKNPYLE